MRDILTDAAVRNAMVVHAAFGGSTNLLLHIPAIAHAAGLPARPWTTGSTSTAACRASSTSLPNGPATTRRCASSWPAACPR